MIHATPAIFETMRRFVQLAYVGHFCFGYAYPKNFTHREMMFAKRVFDLTLLMIAAPLVLLLLVFVAALVRWKLGEPVVFKQQRPGQHGRLFRMYKFRSMTDARDAEGKLLPDEDRLTAFGRLLRSTSLDELPALWNVLKGDMSLVGPRPLLVEYLPLYSAEQARRHAVKPGITGWAQVNGRNAISWERRFSLDVWYVDNHSLKLDIRILFLTMLKVFKRENINEAGNVTRKKFTGNTGI